MFEQKATFQINDNGGQGSTMAHGHAGFIVVSGQSFLDVDLPFT